MKIWIKFGIIIITLALELLFANIMTLDAIKPDLVLIIVICLSFMYGSEDGIIIGFAGGLLKDIFSINLLGTNALVKTIIGYISGTIRERIFQQYLLWIVALATFFFTILNNTFVYYLLGLFHTNYDFMEILKRYLLTQALVNSVLSPFIFIGIRKLLSYAERWS